MNDIIFKTLLLKGEAGNNIETINNIGTEGNLDTFEVTLTDGSTATFTVEHGRGITSVEKTNTVGLVDTYTITYTDNTTSTFEITNASDENIIQFRNIIDNLYFDTVDDMKESSTLKAGDYCKTAGYYSINDGGGALYIITNNNNDTNSYYEQINSNLWAKLIVDNGMVNIKTLGAIADGETENGEKFEVAFGLYKNVYVPSGQYKASFSLSGTGNKLCGDGYSTEIIGTITTNQVSYSIFEDFTIRGIDADNKQGVLIGNGKCVYSWFNNVYFKYAEKCLNNYTSGWWGNHFYKCEFWGNTYCYYDTSTDTNATSFNGCNFYDSEYGIYTSTARDLTVDACIFERVNTCVASTVPAGLNIVNSYFESINLLFDKRAPYNGNKNAVVNISNNYVVQSSITQAIVKLYGVSSKGASVSVKINIENNAFTCSAENSPRVAGKNIIIDTTSGTWVAYKIKWKNNSNELNTVYDVFDDSYIPILFKIAGLTFDECLYSADNLTYYVADSGVDYSHRVKMVGSITDLNTTASTERNYDIDYQSKVIGTGYPSGLCLAYKYPTLANAYFLFDSNKIKLRGLSSSDTYEKFLFDTEYITL